MLCTYLSYDTPAMMVESSQWCLNDGVFSILEQLNTIAGS